MRWPKAGRAKPWRFAPPTQNEAAFEGRVITARVTQLEANPIQGNFYAAHLKAIHKAITVDVERMRPGEFRADPGDHFKHRQGGGTVYSVPYGDARDIEKDLGQALTGKAMVEELSQLPAKAFTERMGRLYQAMDKIHAFEDANSRTNRIFTSQLAKAAGRELDYSRIAERPGGVAEFNRVRDVAVYEASFPQIDFSKPVTDAQLFEIRQMQGDVAANSALWAERIVGGAKVDPNFKDLPALMCEAANIRVIAQAPSPAGSREEAVMRDISPRLAIGLEKGTIVSSDTQGFLAGKDPGNGKASEVLHAAYQAERVICKEVGALGPVSATVNGQMNKLIQQHIAYRIESGNHPAPARDILNAVKMEAAQQQLRFVAELGQYQREKLARVSPDLPGEFSITREQAQWLTAEAERSIEIGRTTGDVFRTHAAQNIARYLAAADLPQQRDRFNNQELRNEYRFTQDEQQNKNRQLRMEMQQRAQGQDMER